MHGGLFQHPAMDERSVHHPELVAQVSRASIRDEITPQLAASVLVSVDGGMKGVPEPAEFVVWVSSAESNLEGSTALASTIGDRLMLGDARSGLLNAFQRPQGRI